MARGMRNLPRSKPEAIVFEGLTWTEQYGSYRTYIHNWIELNVWYSDEKNYKISIAGRLLKSRAKTPNEGARLAIKAAKIWCARVVEDLDKLKEDTNEPTPV